MSISDSSQRLPLEGPTGVFAARHWRANHELHGWGEGEV
jgi:hypothetical protein